MKKRWVRTDTEWVDIEKVEVLDVEEGHIGDRITFSYLGKTYVSYCVSGSRPG